MLLKISRAWRTLISDAHDNIGNQHYRKNDYQKAISSYKKSYELYAWPNPLISLAATYSATGENDLAIEALTRAMEVTDPDYIFYTFNRRARVYSDAGRFEEAITDINVALEAEPENPVFIRTKANILYKMEDYVAALVGYKRLVSMGSDNAWDWRQIAYIQHRKIVDIETAEKSYVQALAMEPDSAWTWHEFATLLYNKKDPRAPAAFQTYLNLCAAGADCDPVMVDSSKKFIHF